MTGAKHYFLNMTYSKLDHYFDFSKLNLFCCISTRYRILEYSETFISTQMINNFLTIYQQQKSKIYLVQPGIWQASTEQ